MDAEVVNKVFNDFMTSQENHIEVIYGHLLKIKKDRNILFKLFIDIAVRSYIETGNFELKMTNYNFGRGLRPTPETIYIYKEDDKITVMFEPDYERRKKDEEEFN